MQKTNWWVPEGTWGWGLEDIIKGIKSPLIMMSTEKCIELSNGYIVHLTLT